MMTDLKVRTRIPGKSGSAMNNKKPKKKTRVAARTARKKSEVKSKQETNPAEVRKEVSGLVEAEATEMARAVIDEAKKGQLAPMKYLFEMASIYPPPPEGTQATSEEDSLAKILLDRLKLGSTPEEKTDETASRVAAQDSTLTAENRSGLEHSGADKAEARSEGNPDGEKKPEGEA